MVRCCLRISVDGKMCTQWVLLLVSSEENEMWNVRYRNEWILHLNIFLCSGCYYRYMSASVCQDWMFFSYAPSCSLIFRFMKRKHLLDVTEVFRQINGEKRLRMLKLLFYAVLLIIIAIRFANRWHLNDFDYVPNCLLLVIIIVIIIIFPLFCLFF